MKLIGLGLEKPHHFQILKKLITLTSRFNIHSRNYPHLLYMVIIQKHLEILISGKLSNGLVIGKTEWNVLYIFSNNKN